MRIQSNKNCGFVILVLYKKRHILIFNLNLVNNLSTIKWQFLIVKIKECSLSNKKNIVKNYGKKTQINIQFVNEWRWTKGLILTNLS